jgi:hypothetical protein
MLHARGPAALGIWRSLVAVAGWPVPAAGGNRPGRPFRAHVASPLPRRYRRHHGGRDHVAARADRGTRNWDYRHCWLRDTALTAHALVSLGSTAEASAFLGWVHRVLAGLGGPERLHPVYALDGSSPGCEAVIDTLPGYAGSRPVRIGNIADQQVQLDVFGPVVELIEAVASRRLRHHQSSAPGLSPLHANAWCMFVPRDAT